MAQPDTMQQLRRLFAGAPLGSTEEAPEQRRLGQFQTDGHVVQHVQMGKHGIALEHHAARGIGLGREGLALQQQLALAGALLPQQQAQEGRLAAAGSTDQGAELAFFHAQVEALQDHVLAVLLPHVANLDVAHARPPSAQGKKRR